MGILSERYTAEGTYRMSDPWEKVLEYEWDENSYEFHLTWVVRNKETGGLFYAEDTGCSCPVPFDDHAESDLKPIKRMQDWYDHLEQKLREQTRYDSDGRYRLIHARIAGKSAEEVRELLLQQRAGQA